MEMYFCDLETSQQAHFVLIMFRFMFRCYLTLIFLISVCSSSFQTVTFIESHSFFFFVRRSSIHATFITLCTVHSLALQLLSTDSTLRRNFSQSRQPSEDRSEGTRLKKRKTKPRSETLSDVL